MKKSFLLFLSFAILSNSLFAQQINGNEETEANQTTELKHTNSAWFKAMQSPNVNYFKVKAGFEKYFSVNKFEDSKPREIGEGWLKSKIFYLDKFGNVQAEPNSLPIRNNKSNSPYATTATTRMVGSWTMIGPVNTKSTNGNQGGYVGLVKMDPTNTSKIFCSFQLGGLWVSTDDGANWALTDNNLPDELYNDIDVAISNPLIVYAISASHVIKSTDGGFSWVPTALSKPTYTGVAYDIAVSPTNPNIVVARWDNKIYRTINGGTSWSQILTGLPNYEIWEGLSSEMLDWSLTENNVVYLLSTSTNSNNLVVYRSADEGATFSILTTITIDPTANGTTVGWGKILQSSNNVNEFYVALGTGASHYGHHAVTLYKLNRTTGAEVAKRVNMITGVGILELHHGDIAMDKLDENKIAFGTYGQYAPHFSNDNGATFTQSSSTIHADQRSLDMQNNNLVIGNDGQASLSTNGGITNVGITNTISNHELWGFGAAFKSATTVAGTNHGPAMVRESGLGFEWTTLSGADQGNTDVNPLDERYVYSQGYDNYLYFRTGFGTFTQVANSLDEGGIYAYFNSFEFHPNLYYSIISHHAGQYPVGNPNLAVWKNSLIRSDDNGATVSIVHTFDAQLFREKICMTNPNVIYTVVGLSNNKVMKTTDGGTVWVDVTPTAAQSAGMTNISDIAVSDADPNQVWITYSGVQNSAKVLRSSNGGAAWSIYGTQTLLTTFPNTKIIFQRGSNGGVYVGNKSGVYYKNNTMPDWVMLGNGLVPLEIRYMFINYNLGKLRIGTSRGAWEHDLYETNAPKAQISVSKNKISCAIDKIQFKDYSTVKNASATWAWSFPGGTPSTSNLENPLVSYEGAAIGTYSVSLTVTDANGTGTQTLSDFIEVLSNDCAIDQIPGKVLTLSAAGDYAQQNEALNITTNTLTISAWIKPNGTQLNNAGIISSSSDGATGINYYGNNKLGYTWKNTSGSYNFNSNLIIPENEWSHVALVVTPTNATLYLNGNPATITAAHATANLNAVFQFGIDRNNPARNFKGKMDEVLFYNRSMTTDEIRELMHLTRNNSNVNELPSIDPTLISYYQFNEGAGKPAYDKIGAKHATLIGGANKTLVSTAPVGGGTFERKNVSAAGLVDFVKPGVEINFGINNPDGDIVVTKLNVAPDQPASPFTLPINPSGYYIIRNFGTNATFDPLNSLKFKDVKGTDASMVINPSNLTLYKRNSNYDGATWGSSIDNADVVTNTAGTGTVEFSAGLNNTSFSQFSIGSANAVLPVSLLYFTAKNIGNTKAFLIWKIEKEIGLQRFEIERSINAVNFSKIGEVAVTGELSYNFTDKYPMLKLNYYRLKMIDVDGKFKYSNIETVKIESEAQMQVSPNPSAGGNISINLVSIANGVSGTISVLNAKGVLTKSLYLNTIENNKPFKINIGAPGVYFVQVSLTNGQKFIKKVVVID